MHLDAPCGLRQRDGPRWTVLDNLHVRPDVLGQCHLILYCSGHDSLRVVTVALAPWAALGVSDAVPIRQSLLI